MLTIVLGPKWYLRYNDSSSPIEALEINFVDGESAYYTFSKVYQEDTELACFTYMQLQGMKHPYPSMTTVIRDQAVFADNSVIWNTDENVFQRFKNVVWYNIV